MVKVLRDYLPENADGKVFVGEYEGTTTRYLVWRISIDSKNAMRTDRDKLPPEMSVCLLDHTGMGQMLKVESHLDDSIVSEETPRDFMQHFEGSQRTFAPDTREIEKVKKLLEKDVLTKNQ